MAGNVYFELTRVFNEHGAIVALASGQAVVHYRFAIMSKDGNLARGRVVQPFRVLR